VTVYPAGASLPDVPSLSWPAHLGASGLAVSALSSSGTVAVHNSSAAPVTVTLDAAGYWLSQGRTVSDVTAKSTTVTLTGSDITAVSGDPAGTQTVTLAAGAPAPAVGRVLVAPLSDTTPDGLLGTVTAVSGGADGSHVVTLSPATLDQAYSTFNVSTSQVVTDSDVVQAPGGQAGQTQTTSATPLPGRQATPAATTSAATASGPPRAELTSSTSYDLSDSAFTCEGSGAGPSISLSADLSKMSVDLSLDANPAAPNIHFLITADPVFDINLGFTGTVTCKLSVARFLEIQVPIPATPGLVVDIYPVITLSADGQASIDFEWSPRAAVGFDKGPGISSEVHAFGSSGQVKISATAGADLFLGFEADLDLAGRVGVGGDLGPDLSASYDARTACLTAQGATEVQLSANANIFVKSWNFALATGTFGARQLYQSCNASSPSALTVSADLPGGTVGTSYVGTVTAAGGDGPYTFALHAGALPAGLSMNSQGIVSGTPQSAGSGTFTVTATDSAGQSASGTYTIDVDAGTGSTGNGTGWTAVEAPLPPNAAGGSTGNGGGAVVVNNGVSGVSCPSASQCAAAGGYLDASERGQGLLLTGSGSSWTATEAPLPSNASASGNAGTLGMSCSSASQCVAAGTYTDSSGHMQGLLLNGAGSLWTAMESPLPANASGTPDAGFFGASCPSASRCVAVGSYTDTAGNSQGLLLTGSGSSWTATEAPLPSNAASSPDASVSGVSCPSASQCVAVGYYQDTSGDTQGLLLTWSGSSWTAVEAPLPSNAEQDNESAGVYGVSCPSASQCVAVGEYQDASGNDQGLLLTGSGSSWTAAEAPLPADANSTAGAGMNDVSCPSASQCVVAGHYTGTSGDTQGLLLTGSGSSWTATRAPTPSNADGSGTVYVMGVSCSSASQCVADGDYTDTSGDAQVYLLTGSA